MIAITFCQPLVCGCLCVKVMALTIICIIAAKWASERTNEQQCTLYNLKHWNHQIQSLSARYTFSPIYLSIFRLIFVLISVTFMEHTHFLFDLLMNYSSSVKFTFWSDWIFPQFLLSTDWRWSERCKSEIKKVYVMDRIASHSISSQATCSFYKEYLIAI